MCSCVYRQALTEALARAFPDMASNALPWPEHERREEPGTGWVAAPPTRPLTYRDPAEIISRIAQVGPGFSVQSASGPLTQYASVKSARWPDQALTKLHAPTVYWHSHRARRNQVPCSRAWAPCSRPRRAHPRPGQYQSPAGSPLVAHRTHMVRVPLLPLMLLACMARGRARASQLAPRLLRDRCRLDGRGSPTFSRRAAPSRR